MRAAHGRGGSWAIRLQPDDDAARGDLPVGAHGETVDLARPEDITVVLIADSALNNAGLQENSLKPYSKGRIPD